MRPDPVEEGKRWLRQARPEGGTTWRVFWPKAQIIIQQAAEFLEGTGEDDSV